MFEIEKGQRFEADKGGAGAGVPSPEAPESITVTSPEPTTGGEKTFTQADLDRIVTERLKREQERATAAAEAAAKKEREKALAENQEWQKLAEQRDAELKAMQARLREAEIHAAAARLGFEDSDYAVFLVQRAGEGADVEAVLREHAKAKPTAPSGSPTNPQSSNAFFTREQLRDPKYFEANRDAIMLAMREGRIKD